ncbi:MAG TPA: Crp/Fnr family transcriptional regulator [Anaerolineales bacterium]
MNEALEVLHRSSYFSSLSAEDLALVAQGARLRRYARGEKIVLYGDAWPYFLLIVDGQVDAIKESGEGRSLLVTTFDAGDVFWGVAFFLTDSPMPVTLEARTDCVLYLWETGDLQPVLERNGTFMWNLSRLMVSRMLHASEMLEGLAFQPVAGRLARLLAELPHDEKSGAVSRSLTLDEMAARIGTTREMVCRFLYRFAGQGMISITRTEFAITDMPALMDLAQAVKG